MRLLVPLLLLTAGCQKSTTPPPPAEAVEAPDAGAPIDPRAKEEACLDAWLAQQKLDAYGSPEGTMYAGGTPLFDERTGETKDRLEFVYARHPDAKAACRTAAP